jgi:hypothetical protein
MRNLFAFFIFLLPFTCLAQYSISGRVIDLADKKPVADASVFLNNATVGTKTADNGTFTINSVRPGQYDLVVSIVGYETYHQAVMVNNNISLPDIQVLAKTIQLKEVRIGPNRNWDRDYETFKRLFFGVSDYTDQCKILNPDVLDLDFNPSTLVFSAKSSDFIVIENNALGYRIKYLLSELTNDSRSGELYFEGSASFEEMKGSEAKQRRWKKNRLNAYLGSSMHFLRSAISNTITTEGFKAFRLIRKPDPKYPAGAKRYIQTLVNKPLSVSDMVKLTDIKGQFALGFDDCLYIAYNKKFRDTSNTKNKGPATIPVPDYLSDPQTTIVVFIEPYAFFDFNGIIINPRSIIYNGDWGKSRIAELLPVDYVP